MRRPTRRERRYAVSLLCSEDAIKTILEARPADISVVVDDIRWTALAPEVVTNPINGNRTVIWATLRPSPA